MSLGDNRLNIPVNLEVDAIFRSVDLFNDLEADPEAGEEEEASGPEEEEPKPSVVVSPSWLFVILSQPTTEETL